jgi:hypothetical protein
MKIVKCGMFGLPGVSFGRDEIDDDLLSEMKEWVEQSGCGIHMTDRLFSFKNSGHLDFFLLRWADRVPKKDKE